MRIDKILLAVMLLDFFSAWTSASEILFEKQLNNNWYFRQVETKDWMPAKVPGCNHTDLLANRKISDPFWRLNETNLQWIDKKDWEYKTVFIAKPELLRYDRIQIEFEGLDTYAEVFLNGNKVLSADNMFRKWQTDIKNILKPGENELHVVLRSPIAEGLKKYNALGYVLPTTNKEWAERGQVEGGKRVFVHTRKANYHFGWDWGPRLVSSGIWRPVKLKAWNHVLLKDLQIVQKELTEKSASLTAKFEVEAATESPATFEVMAEDSVLASKQVLLKKGTTVYEVDLEIKDPKLWWCNGLGDPHLYSITGKLKTDTGSIDRSMNIGLRTVKLVRKKDDAGTSFYFEVNGVPVFMKGANYIPSDIYPSRVSDARYWQIIETAKNSNFNMLRVWGGGIYENDIFYDLCDKAGILVWQDFMFACAMFPGDEAFLENVRQEAIDNVKRLRNHPCIAMWCGNNEILTGWHRWGWKRRQEKNDPVAAKQIWESYTNLFNRVLPAVIEEFDPSRFYWASSPSAGREIPSDLQNGDEHYWGVWHKKMPFETYSTHIARFMSEYGFQSFPELRTINEFALPEDYGLLSDVMKHHQRSNVGNNVIEHYMLQSYRKPKDFELLVYVGQVLQAEIIKYAAEAHRRAKPFCMGTLYWQLDDCWPVASWSSMDSSLRWKALQYFIKKVYEPVLISIFEKDNTLSVHVVNDHLHELSGTLKLNLVDFHGQTLWKKMLPCSVPANSSTIFFETDRATLLKDYDASQTLLKAEWIENEAATASSLFYFKKIKELVLPQVTVTPSFRQIHGGFEISLRADQLAKNLYLSIDDKDGFFSDNYFDLLPGETVSVILTTDLSLHELQQVFTCRTLRDTY